MAVTQLRRQQIADELTAGDFAAASVDGAAGTASLRTLGTGAQQAAAGDHTHTAFGALTLSSPPTLTGFTAGSVLFAGTGGLVSQDNANLFWDDTNNRLGIGTPSPAASLDVVTAAVTTYGVSVVGSGFSSLDPTIFSPSTWAPSVRVGRDLNLVGTGTNGSANQFAVVVQTQTAATSSGASYEKGGIITIARSSDPSTGTSVTRDVVGLDTRGYVAAGNTVARVWGGITQSYIEATGDGYAVAWEVEATNNATADQAVMNTTTTKVGVHVVTDGSQNGTCAIVVNAAGSARWHKGLYSHDGVITSTGNFLQYVSSVSGSDLFSVTAGGTVTVAGSTYSTAAQLDSTSWGVGLVRVGRVQAAAGSASAGSANEFGVVVQGYTSGTTGSTVPYEKAAVYGVAQTVDPSYNAVRYLTVTAAGSGYTTPPTLTIAAPGGTSASAGAGVTATAIAYLGINTAAPSAGGSGYAVGDVIFLSAGTGRATAFLTVATLSGSAVATVTVSVAGEYTAVPANPAATTALSGVGTGCTLTLNWKVVTAQITKNGWGYTTTAPTVTVGSGTATVTATATTNDVTRDCVGIHGSGIINTLNTSGRAWALYGIAYVEAGADGYVSCAEIELRNGATTDQPLVNTATSKVGLHIVASGGAWGTQNGTCALYLNGAGTSLWHKGMYMEPADLSTTATGAFIELLNAFKVTRAGVVTALSCAGLLLPTAGTATAGTAPVKFTSGTNLTTAEAGAVEYDGKAFYATPAASGRSVLTAEQLVVATADFTLSAASGAQNLFTAANDVLTVAASTTYEFEAVYYLTTGATTHTTAVLFGGTATYTSVMYTAELWSGTAGTISTTAPSFLVVTAATSTVLNATSTATMTVVRLRGTIRVNAAGTLIPQVNFSANPTGTNLTKTNSYFRLWPVGSDTVAAVGNWG